MKKEVSLDTVYAPSENVVARDIHGEFIIVPVTSGVSESDEDMFTLNETGRAIWDKMDGKTSLKDIVKSLNSNFEGAPDVIEKDAVGLVKELLKRKMLIPASKN